MNLQDKLIEKEKMINQNIPKFIQNYMRNQTRQIKLSNSKFEVGHILPNCEFLNEVGQKVNLYNLIKDKPAIIKFYRGAWCPYCNLELNEYEQLIKGTQINMFAISYEKPNLELEKKYLSMTILSDLRNKFSKKLGLTFVVPPFLRFIYRISKIKLDTLNLAVPALYVIDKNKKISYSFVETDYKKRADPLEVISEYRLIEAADNYDIAIGNKH